MLMLLIFHKPYRIISLSTAKSCINDSHPQVFNAQYSPGVPVMLFTNTI